MSTWKRDKDLKFRLKDLIVNPEFSIWRAWDKRNELIKDPAGNEMRFPIRDGSLTNVKGEIKEVADLKFMPTNMFKEQFPNLMKSFKYTRSVIVDGIEYNYSFSKTANAKIIELIETLQMSKVDPLSAEFQQSYKGSESAASRYSMKVIATGLAPVISSSTQPSTIGGVSRDEQEIIDAIKSVHSNNVDEIRFVEIMKQNSVTQERAKEIYKIYKG